MAAVLVSSSITTFGPSISSAVGDQNYVFLSDSATTANAVLCSQNAGASWSMVTVPNPQSVSWKQVKYGGGMFMAIGGSLSGVSCASSATGLTWTGLSGGLTIGVWIDVAYGNSTWVAVCSNPIRSARSINNGASWTNYSIPITPEYVTFGGGVFLANPAIYSTSYATTTDGITWAAQTAPFSIGRATYGNGVFVAPASGGVGVSTNGLNWTFVALPFEPQIHIIYNGTYFITMMNGIFNKSLDGVAWTALEAVAVSSARSSSDSNILASWFSGAWNHGLITGLDIGAPPPPPPIFWTSFIGATETI